MENSPAINLQSYVSFIKVGLYSLLMVEFIIACFLGLFMGISLLGSAISKFLLVQKIKNLPTSKVSSIAVGLVELFGTGKCKNETKTPISKTNCLYWKVTCEKYSELGDSWKLIFTDSSSNNFYLQDKTGKILIDPTDAEINIPLVNHYQGHIYSDGKFIPAKKFKDGPIVPYINSVQYNKKKGPLSGADFRLKECYIMEGDPLFIIGNAQPLDSASNIDTPQNLIVKKGMFDPTMFITTSNENIILRTTQNLIYQDLVLGIILSSISLYVLLIFFVK